MADYRKMWESLGMDLETHDQLCEVLPQAFGDVFLSQENRPEAMDYYNFVIAEIHGVRPQELIKAQEEGKKVFGTFCVYVPDELIFAANAIATGLCGGSQFWVPGGEKVLPTNTCPLIKASVGARLDRTCPFFRIADMYIGETTCDGKKKAWEILGEDVPVHVMDLPQMKREKDIKAWAEEIKELKKVIEEFTGNKVTAESLSESIKLINNKRKALSRLYECRKADKVPISGRDALVISQIAFYDDPARFTQMTNKLCDELEQRIKDGVSVVKEGTKSAHHETNIYFSFKHAACPTCRSRRRKRRKSQNGLPTGRPRYATWQIRVPTGRKGRTLSSAHRPGQHRRKSRTCGGL